MKILHYLLTLALLLSAAACDKDPLTLSPEELAERIRANTPTELPPITTTGANTMGAYIHTDTGRVLFVASGVDRPETALAESLDCEAFNNLLYANNNYLSVRGIYCRRPEIGDDRRISMGFGYFAPDSVQISLSYDPDDWTNGPDYWTREFSQSGIEYEILRDDRQARVFSGTFSGYLLNRAPPYDTLQITDGRFDVTYGITP